MKIYIETEMKELPKGCTECKNKSHFGRCITEKQEVTYFDGKNTVEHFNSRPIWCPLRTETEIVDKAKENE